MRAESALFAFVNLMTEQLAIVRADQLALREVVVSLVQMQTGLSEGAVHNELIRKELKCRKAMRVRVSMPGIEHLPPAAAMEASLTALRNLLGELWRPACEDMQAKPAEPPAPAGATSLKGPLRNGPPPACGEPAAAAAPKRREGVSKANRASNRPAGSKPTKKGRG